MIKVEFENCPQLVVFSDEITDVLSTLLYAKEIRIHKKLFKKKFSLYALGQCLCKTYQESIPGLKAIDVILAADNSALVSKFEPICKTAKIISGENKKLKWEADGVVSCDDLNCDVCEEKPTCDTLKDIVVKRMRDK